MVILQSESWCEMFVLKLSGIPIILGFLEIIAIFLYQNDNDQCPDTTADSDRKEVPARTAVAAKRAVATETAAPAKPDHDTKPLPAKISVPAKKAVADTTSDVGRGASTTVAAPSISSSSEGRVKSSKERIAVSI